MLEYGISVSKPRDSESQTHIKLFLYFRDVFEINIRPETSFAEIPHITWSTVHINT